MWSIVETGVLVICFNVLLDAVDTHDTHVLGNFNGVMLHGVSISLRGPTNQPSITLFSTFSASPNSHTNLLIFP